MSSYSIKDLEQVTGIKAHTIRIWEQRYNFLQPSQLLSRLIFSDKKALSIKKKFQRLQINDLLFAAKFLDFCSE